MKEVFINTFDGVLDTDADPVLGIQPQDFLSALNIRRKPGSNIIESYVGNSDLGWVPPAGTNEMVGAISDNICKTIIFFIKNSNNDHVILRYFVLEDRFEEFIDSVWNLDALVHSGVVVDGRFLIYTDAEVDNKLTITGNRVRYIDLEKLSLYQKNLCYEFHYDQDSFPLGANYYIRITDLDGNDIVATTLVRTSAGGGADAEFAVFYTTLDGAGYDITVEDCGSKLKVTADNPEEIVIITSDQNDIHWVKINHYPDLIEPFITLARYMPKCPVAPFQFNDAGFTENNIFSFTFQFRYRYIYFDGYRSKWSSVSYVPTNFVQAAGANPTLNSTDYNAIRLEFDDDLLLSADWKSLIKKVEIGVRTSDTGVIKLVDTIDVADIGVTVLEYIFRNVGANTVVASDESSEPDVQALGNFSFVPRLSSSIESISDDRGNYTIGLYGNLEQYDMPDCIDADIADDSGFTVTPPTTATDQSQTRRKLKTGGSFDLYSVYEDDYGVQSPAVYLGEYRIPFDLAVRHRPQVTINTPPPIWATRFRFAISRNKNQAVYLQAPCIGAQAAQYWQRDQTDGTFTNVTYASGNADYVSFKMDIAELEDNRVNFLFKEGTSQFLVESGDKIQVMTAPGGNYQIAGYNLTNPAASAADDAYYVYFEFDPAQPDYTLVGPTDFHVIELYRQSEAGSYIPLELPECYDVADAGLPTRNHGGTQTIDYGDTFEFNADTGRFYGNGTSIIVQGLERPYLHLERIDKGSDFGRAVPEDDDYREIFKYNEIRVSDIYIPETNSNSLSNFKGTEYIRTKREVGPGMKLTFIRSVMLAIGRYGTHPIYVGQDGVIDLSGNTTFGISNRVLNLANNIFSYGTHDPATITNNGRYVYGWDVHCGAPWRYSLEGGIDPINIKNVSLFQDIGDEYRGISGQCIAGFHKDFETWFLTFKGSSDRTYAFKEGEGWLDEVSFVPEFYGLNGTFFVTGKNGLVWEHENGNPNEFYGSQYDSEIKFSVNPRPTAIKLYWNIVEEGDLWIITDIETQTNPVMSSRVSSVHFAKKEGQWKANLLRDGNDPNFLSVPLPQRYITAMLQGRHLRGEAMIVTLQLNDSTVLGKLRTFKTEVTLSNKTY